MYCIDYSVSTSFLPTLRCGGHLRGKIVCKSFVSFLHNGIFANITHKYASVKPYHRVSKTESKLKVRKSQNVIWKKHRFANFNNILEIKYFEATP